MTRINATTHRIRTQDLGQIFQYVFNKNRKQQSMKGESSHDSSICSTFTCQKSPSAVLLTPELRFHGKARWPHKPAAVAQ